MNEEQQAEALKQLYEDVLATFNPPRGRRVLDHLKSNFHYNRPMYEPGMSDSHLAFREGQRSVILSILDTVEEAIESLNKTEQVQTHYAEGQPNQENN